MKAVIVTGKYAQDREVWYPYYRMDEEGWEVDIQVQDNMLVYGVIGEKIQPTKNWLQDFHSYDVVILPGGARALEYLRQDQPLLNALTAYEGVIGSICHGTQLLISSGRCRGKMVSGYYSIKDDIINAGGTFVDGPFVRDGKLVCSPHYRYLGPWMREVIRVARLPRGVGEGEYGVQ